MGPLGAIGPMGPTGGDGPLGGDGPVSDDAPLCICIDNPFGVDCCAEGEDPLGWLVPDEITLALELVVVVVDDGTTAAADVLDSDD